MSPSGISFSASRPKIAPSRENPTLLPCPEAVEALRSYAEAFAGHHRGQGGRVGGAALRGHTARPPRCDLGSRLQGRHVPEHRGRLRRRLEEVIDINPRKRGRFVPRTGQRCPRPGREPGRPHPGHESALRRRSPQPPGRAWQPSWGGLVRLMSVISSIPLALSPMIALESPRPLWSGRGSGTPRSFCSS